MKLITEMKTAEKRAKGYAACALALQSPCVQASIASTVQRELDKWGGLAHQSYFGKEVDPTLESGFRGEGLLIQIRVADESLYDALMNCKDTGIDMKEIQANYSIENVLVSYGISCKINFQFSCPLPMEDLAVLHMLGKVKYDPGYSSAPAPYISCEV